MSTYTMNSSTADEQIVRPPFLVRARPWLIALPALLVLIGILYPFVVGVYYSLTAYALNRPGSLEKFVWFQNYGRMFADKDFLYSTYVTFAYAILATGTELVLGLVVALLLNRNNWVSRTLQPTLVFPMMIAPVIGTLIWKLMMQPSVGILNPMLESIGLPTLQWAAAPETALMSVVLVDVWMFTPFAALILLAGLRSLPQAPFEAARVDGASFWFTFRNLTLPMLTLFIRYMSSSVLKGFLRTPSKPYCR